MEGTQWVRSVLTTAVVFPAPVFAVFVLNNLVAALCGSIAALPAWAVLVVFLLWAIVTLPSIVLGAVLGKNRHRRFYAPVATNKYAREIPPQPWYTRAAPQVLLAGLLPFAGIYVELHYVLASAWSHKTYAVFPILAVLFATLLLTTAGAGVVMTYFLLDAEDHRWWWRAFAGGAAVGGYTMAYSVLWFHVHSRMSGVLQLLTYFSYNALGSLAIAIVLGTVSWRASLAFLRTVYRAIKSD